MKIEPTKIQGAYVVRREPVADERGSFARMFCRRELEAAGLCGEIAQVNLSMNHKKGTLRGLHFQKGDAAEVKLVACVQGTVFDVCADIREGSPTYGQWIGEILSAQNGTSMYIPQGCAHGFLTLADDSQLVYFMSEFYAPGSAAGARYDDPLFSICWPFQGPYIISEQDAKWEYIHGVTPRKDR